MSIAVTCPSGHSLIIADNMAGRAGRCPFCREIVHVPALGHSAEAEKSALAGGARPGPALANPATPASRTPPSSLPPTVAAPDPAAADTVLMPLSLSEVPLPNDGPLQGQQTSVEPEPPVAAAAEPGQMAQTLPLPTAELVPKRSAGTPDPAHDISFDTAGRKGRILGKWKVFGDVEPPYVPEPALGRAGAAVGAADARVAPSAARTGPPPLPSARPSGVVGAEIARAHPESQGAVAPNTSWFGRTIAKGSAQTLRATVNRIAAGLVMVSVFSMWPALRYWDLGVAPGWARGLLLVALLQLAYAVWLVSIPDWASLWATMFVLAIVATLYGTAAALALATADPPLGLESLRHTAPAWCCGVMLLTISAAYLCGHAAQRFRRASESIVLRDFDM